MTKRKQKLKAEKPTVGRDLNILKAAQGEINLGTRCTAPNKKIYRRKEKHSGRGFDY